MTPLYLHGRSLISALGADLQQAVTALAAGGVTPQRIQLPGGTEWPFFSIAYPETQWRVRAEALLRSAIAQAGVADRCELPLFIASSSLQIGATETEEQAPAGDYYNFAEEVAAWLGWHGPVYLISTACTSAMHALLAAAAHIRSGAADEAVVLGVELSNRYTLAGFAAMQLLSPTSPRPLGTTRDGLVLGEAVAALHLSRHPSRWCLRGGSNLLDGSDPTGASPATVSRLCHQALQNSGLAMSDIDLIKAQAAGSPVNDLNEIRGLTALFGTLPPLTTLKAAIGHTLGASGAAEIALLLECLEKGVWPRSTYPLDPEAGTVLTSKMPTKARHILAIILGFGGGYSAVALEDCNG